LGQLTCWTAQFFRGSRAIFAPFKGSFGLRIPSMPRDGWLFAISIAWLCLLYAEIFVLFLR